MAGGLIGCVHREPPYAGRRQHGNAPWELQKRTHVHTFRVGQRCPRVGWATSTSPDQITVRSFLSWGVNGRQPFGTHVPA